MIPTQAKLKAVQDSATPKDVSNMCGPSWGLQIFIDGSSRDFAAIVNPLNIIGTRKNVEWQWGPYQWCAF